MQSSISGGSGAAIRLNALLVQVGQEPLGTEPAARFEAYLSLLLRWNERMNLTAIREEEGILSRHFVESICCARAIPDGVQSLLDFGSGAGFPGIPIALCRPEISVTLAESQGKKAGFLREAVRVLGLSANVHGDRAETLGRCFDCVALRAVDRMGTAVGVASGLVAPGGWLALMTTRADLAGLQAAAGSGLSWGRVVGLAGSEDRVVAFGRRDRLC